VTPASSFLHRHSIQPSRASAERGLDRREPPSADAFEPIPDRIIGGDDECDVAHGNDDIEEDRDTIIEADYEENPSTEEK
jgi:hypothetical protein